MTNTSDNIQLIEALKAGDEKIFAKIYESYSTALFANICKLKIDQHQAEDILQEVFIELWNSRNKLTTSHSVAGWLFTTSYYKSVSHLKKVVRQSIVAVHDELSDLPESATDVSSFEKEYSQKLSVLSDAIDQLPRQKKQAFTLSRIEGRAYSEIASILNVSEDTARDYVKSATGIIKKNVRGQQSVNPPAELVLAFLVFNVLS